MQIASMVKEARAANLGLHVSVDERCFDCIHVIEPHGYFLQRPIEGRCTGCGRSWQGRAPRPTDCQFCGFDHQDPAERGRGCVGV